MSIGRPSLVAALAIAASLAADRADAQSKLSSVVGTGRADRLGRSVAFTPAVDGAGVPDFLVGAPNDYYSFAHLGTAGRALLYSGATNGLLRTFDGDAEQDSFGTTVASLGDVDGDGVPDFAI